MGVRWRIAVLVLATSGVAVAQATPPPVTLASSGPSPAFTRALGNARAAKKKLEKQRTPRPKAGADPRQFISRDLAAWLSESRKLHDEARDRYGDALPLAPGAAERVAVWSEVGEMSLAFAERVYRVGEAAMPPNIAKSAELRSVYLSALDDALAPARESASATLVRCAELAQATRVKTPAATRCETLRDKPWAVEPKPVMTPATGERAIRQQQRKLRQCYERALEKEPTLTGELLVKMTIGAGGKVTDLGATGSLSSHPVASCISDLMRALPFPAPPKGTKVTLSYPLKLDPAR